MNNDGEIIKEMIAVTPIDNCDHLAGTYEMNLSYWLGRAFHLKRATMNALKDIDALKQPGIYFLYGTTIDKNGSLRLNVYVGQANSRQNGKAVFGRIKEHDTKKDKDSYWTDAIAFVEHNNKWGGTEISYLEHQFLKLIRQAKGKNPKHYWIRNENTPSLGHIPPEVYIRMDNYIKHFLKLLHIMGFDFFEKENDSNNADDPDLPFNPSTEEAGQDVKQSTPQFDPAKFPFKVGQIMSFAFREALEKGLLKDDIKFLKSEKACKIFRTRGYRVIASGKRPSKDTSGVNRFSAKPAYFEGKAYWITTQVYSEGLEPILTYLEKHGMSRDNVIALCQKCCQKEVSSEQTSQWRTKQLAWWTAFMEYAMKQADFTQYFNRRKSHAHQWIALSSGSSKCQISLTVTKNRLGVELYIRKSMELFNALLENKESIENDLGFQMDWQSLQGRKASRIAIYLPGDYKYLVANEVYFKWYCEKAIAIKKVFSCYLS